MLYTGMRVGEVGGLRWADIDFEKEEIHITHTLVFDGSSTNKTSEYGLNPPKTKSSKRCIPISPRVKEALLNEKKRQEENGIKCKITINGYSDFVFLDDKGGLFHYKKLNHRLDRLSAAIDAEIKNQGMINGLTAFPHVHSHMLRHTFATRMREAGADIKATADIMGHNEVDITLNTYTDASEDFKKQEISLLDLREKIEVV
jgi:integrase